MRVVYLHHTQVTEEGVEKLLAQLPNADVRYKIAPVTPNDGVTRTWWVQPETTRLVIQSFRGDVRIIHPGSPADLAGMTIGDKILSINGTKIASEVPIRERIPSGGTGAMKRHVADMVPREEKMLLKVVKAMPLESSMQLAVERNEEEVTLIARLGGTGR